MWGNVSHIVCSRLHRAQYPSPWSMWGWGWTRLTRGPSYQMVVARVDCLDGSWRTPVLYNSFSGEKQHFSRRRCPGNSRATAIPFFWWTETLSVQFPLRVEGRRKEFKDFWKMWVASRGKPSIWLVHLEYLLQRGGYPAKFRALSELTDTDSWSELCTWVCSCQGREGAMKWKGCWMN